MSEFFLTSPIPGVVVWTLLYASDFFLTIICARLYQRGVKEKIVFEGSYELNPVFQRDIDSLRFVSPRFLAMLVLGGAMLVMVWILNAGSALDVYSFVLGAGIGLQLAIHLRHFRNLFLFRSITNSDAVRGRIEYSRPILLRMSSAEMLAFSGFFAILFAFTRSSFVLGAVVACLLTAAQHWWLASKHAANKSA